MINGLGIVGLEAGGIEAESVCLVNQFAFKHLKFIGVHLEGELPEGATATDMTLQIWECSAQKRSSVNLLTSFIAKVQRSLFS